MKTKLFLLLSLISIQSFSQGLEQTNGTAVYFKGGLNIANFVNWDDKIPTETLAGASGGMGVYIRLGQPRKKTTGLTIEAVFSGQGFKLEHNDQEVKVKTTYFNASLQVRRYLGHFFLTAGPEHGFLVSAKEFFESGESEYAPDGIYKSNVWNGIAGMGFNFGDKTSRQIDFGFELTYRHGLSQVRTDFVKARHSVFNLSMFIPVSIVADIASGM